MTAPADLVDGAEAVPVGAPRRVQRSRKTGARLEPGAVPVDRTSHWGNPYPAGEHGRGEAVRRHRADLLAGTLVNTRGHPITVADVRRELAGRTLACWCALDQPCHADTLLEVANSPEPPGIGEDGAGNVRPT